MRNALQRWAEGLNSKFFRHDLDADDFRFDSKYNGATIKMVASEQGGLYMCSIDLSQMKHGDSFTALLEYPVDLAFEVYLGSLNWGQYILEGAYVLGVVKFECYDGEIYV